MQSTADRLSSKQRDVGRKNPTRDAVPAPAMKIADVGLRGGLSTGPRTAEGLERDPGQP